MPGQAPVAPDLLKQAEQAVSYASKPTAFGRPIADYGLTCDFDGIPALRTSLKRADGRGREGGREGRWEGGC